MIFSNGFFSWNAVALSAHVREVRLTPRKAMVPDNDTMGTTGEKFVAHLLGYDLEVIFRQDYSAAAVDATLAADTLAGTARAWVARPDAGAIGATNPEYRGTGFISEYAAIEGAFGEILGARIRIMPSVAGVTRATV